MPTETDRTLAEGLSGIARADLIVGIPSYNNAKTIAHVVDMARQGLRRSFPALTGVVVNSDGGSEDGTRDIVIEQDTPELRVVSGRYTGPSGKGSALHAVFAAVTQLGARAACVVDSDLRSITPDWISACSVPPSTAAPSTRPRCTSGTSTTARSPTTSSTPSSARCTASACVNRSAVISGSAPAWSDGGWPKTSGRPTSRASASTCS